MAEMVVDELNIGKLKSLPARMIFWAGRHPRGINRLQRQSAATERSGYWRLGDPSWFHQSSVRSSRAQIRNSQTDQRLTWSPQGFVGCRNSQTPWTVSSQDLGRGMSLVASNISMSFGAITALKDIDLQLNKGEILGLIGPNGGGKTTLVNIVSGFQKPTTGKVHADGTDLSAFSPQARSYSGVVRTFGRMPGSFLP